MELNFSLDKGCIPAVVQDEYTSVVLMTGYMNKEAYNLTRQENKIYFVDPDSAIVSKIFIDNDISLTLTDLKTDHHKRSVLLKVRPVRDGAMSHYNEKNEKTIAFLSYLQDLIEKRKKEMPEGSYTTKLFRKGVNKIAQKLGEEAVEMIIESKDENRDLFLNEGADLLYHYLVLLSQKNCRIEDIADILRNRHK